MEGQRVVCALGDAWGLVRSCSPQTLPWRLLEGLASPSATPSNSWAWSGASPWAGSAWNCPRHHSTCRPGVHPHTAPVSLGETWTALSAVRSWRRCCHAEPGTLRPPSAEACPAPSGISSPFSVSPPCFVSSPEDRDGAVHPWPLQKVTPFFRATPVHPPRAPPAGAGRDSVQGTVGWVSLDRRSPHASGGGQALSQWVSELGGTHDR